MKSNYLNLIYQLAKREVYGRYKGSALGVLWSFVNPLLMLCVYTVFFSFILEIRWGQEAAGKSSFAIFLFVGLITHGFIAECINRAPGLIVGNANYVKKVVFPVAVLPVVSSLSALFHWVIGLFVFFLAMLVLSVPVPATFPLVFIVMIPLVLYGLGVGWLLAALGVYIRDISQMVGVFSQILLFMSPVFFPVSKIPPQYQEFFLLNPLTAIIEQARAVTILGQLPDWRALAFQLAVSVSVGLLGYLFFKKARRGFADVL